MVPNSKSEEGHTVKSKSPSLPVPAIQCPCAEATTSEYLGIFTEKGYAFTSIYSNTCLFFFLYRWWHNILAVLYISWQPFHISTFRAATFFKKIKTIFKLNYTWCSTLYKLQVYNIVIHNFKRLYSIYSYYKILAMFPMLYNISL